MCVMATGGGSYKFYERMKKELDVEVVQEDEMECLIVGTSTRQRCTYYRS
jgi:type II pantothenate kinase